MRQEFTKAHIYANNGEYGYSACLAMPEVYNRKPEDCSEEQALLQRLNNAKQRYSELRKQYGPQPVSAQWQAMSDEECRQKVEQSVQALTLDLDEMCADEAMEHVATYLEANGKPSVDRRRISWILQHMWDEQMLLKIERKRCIKERKAKAKVAQQELFAEGIDHATSSKETP